MSAPTASAAAPRAIIEPHLIGPIVESCISDRGARAAPCCALADLLVGHQRLRAARAAVAIAVGLADCHRAHAACSRTATAAHPVSGQPIVTCRLLLGDRCVED